MFLSLALSCYINETYLQKQSISVQLDVRFEVGSDDVTFTCIPRCPQATSVPVGGFWIKKNN